MHPTLSLAEWRRQINHLYAEIRKLHPSGPHTAWMLFRETRDQLFATHDQTPLNASQLQRFTALPYFDYDPNWRFELEVFPASETTDLEIQLRDDGIVKLRQFGTVTLPIHNVPLNLYWIKGYGGGIFLPFGDTTNNNQTFGGGRYLLDTIKGADLGMSENRITLDFNFSYNPSCAYNDKWSCPLTPPENRLPFSVPVGEQKFPNF